jgi:hypothetical protein
MRYIPGVDVLEHGVPVLPVHKILRRDAVTVALNFGPDHDKLVGLRVRHGCEQRGVDHCEDGSGGAYAEGKREDRCERESWRFA